MSAHPTLTFIVVPLGLAIAGLALAIAKMARDAAVADAKISAARHFGLFPDTTGQVISGYAGHQSLFVGTKRLFGGSVAAPWAVVTHQRSLGLGLDVRRKKLPGRIADGRSEPCIGVADPDLHRFFDIRGDDPDRVRALLDPEVRARLLALHRQQPNIVISDTEVAVFTRLPPSSSRAIRRLLCAMMGVSDALTEARSRVDAPAAFSALSSWWTPFAHAHGLDPEPGMPSLRGTHGVLPVEVTPQASPSGGPGATVTLQLSGVASPRFEVVQAGQTPSPLTGPPVLLDHDEFDAAFVTFSVDPHWARVALHPEVRATLLRLNPLGRVHVDEHRLRIENLSPDPGVLDDALRAAMQCADALLEARS